MSESNIERQLSALPQRSLPDGADDRILTTIRDARPAAHGNARWKMYTGIAACLVFGLLGWLWMSDNRLAPETSTQHDAMSFSSTTIVLLDEPFLSRPTPNVDRLDIGRWKILDLSPIRPANTE